MEADPNIGAGLVVIVFVFALMAGLIVTVIRIQRRKLREAFADMASRLGCPAVIPQGIFGGFPSLSGTYRRHPLRVFMFTRSSGSGKSRSTTTYTAFEVSVENPAGFEFHIFEQGFFTSLAVKFGMQDIQIGDPDFDQEYMVQSNNEALVREMVTPMIRQQFMDLAARYVAFGIRLKAGGFYHEAAGSVAAASFRERFETMINFTCDIADQLDALHRHRRM